LAVLRHSKATGYRASDSRRHRPIGWRAQAVAREWTGTAGCPDRTVADRNGAGRRQYAGEESTFGATGGIGAADRHLQISKSRHAAGGIHQTAAGIAP